MAHRRRRPLRRGAARRRIRSAPSARAPARASCATELALGRCCSPPSRRLALLAPSERALSPLGAVGLIAAYAIAQQVQFDVGAGYTVPEPARAHADALRWRRRRSCRCSSRPACWSGGCRRYLRREVASRRAPSSCCPTPGTRSAPAAGHGRARAGARSVSRLARPGPRPRRAGRSSTPASPCCAIWLALGSPPQLQLRPLGWMLAVDVALAPVGVLAGVAAQRQPLAVAARAAAHGPARPLRARAARAHRQGARALARLPRHRSAHERPARGRRRLHRRRAQPRRRRAGACGRRRPRARRARPPQPRVRRAAARHRQDPRAPTRSSTSPAS